VITVKTAVDQASREIGVTQQPITQAIGSSDQDIAQMTALLQAVADEVVLYQPYVDSLGDGYWLIDPVSGTRKARPTADTDYILFDGRLAIAGLKYRFLQAKGLEFGEQLRDYSDRQNRLAATMNAQVVDLNNDPSPFQ